MRSPIAPPVPVGVGVADPVVVPVFEVVDVLIWLELDRLEPEEPELDEDEDWLDDVRVEEDVDWLVVDVVLKEVEGARQYTLGIRDEQLGVGRTRRWWHR